jgi:GrpB-like predicted nucleotidyltransferase (UPF0157 family)/GNAT superfamily N-acetyltransferase
MRLALGTYVAPQPAFREADPGAALVARALADAIVTRDPRLRVEHVGSSSVPGLGGKGYVDLLVLYPEGMLDAAKDALAALGFQRQGGRDPWPETRPMRVARVEHDGRTYPVHAHVVAANAGEVEELLHFRDRLRSDPALQRAYETEKRRILAGGVLDGVDYAEKKSTFVRRVLAELTMRLVRLEPMMDAEAVACLDAIAGPYAAARAAADRVTLEAAERYVRAQRAALLPDGPRTAGHRFHRIVSTASGETVGHVWLHVDAAAGQAFVYDVAILPAHRRRRFATSALTWVETIARDAGCATLALNVFADNRGAMAMYHILGFQAVAHHMNKVIRDDG